jgi:hypothetical protein
MGTEAGESLLLETVIRQQLVKKQQEEKIWYVLYSYGRNLDPCIMYECMRGGPSRLLHRDLQWSIVLHL